MRQGMQSFFVRRDLLIGSVGCEERPSPSIAPQRVIWIEGCMRTMLPNFAEVTCERLTSLVRDTLELLCLYRFRCRSDRRHTLQAAYQTDGLEQCVTEKKLLRGSAETDTGPSHDIAWLAREFSWPAAATLRGPQPLLRLMRNFFIRLRRVLGFRLRA